MSKFYHPFMYRYLFKNLQYLISESIENLEVDPKVSTLEDWSKSNVEFFLSRNTLQKVMGKPTSKSKGIAENTLNQITKYIFYLWQEREIPLWSKVESENLKKGEFREFMRISEFPDIPPDFVSLSKNCDEDYQTLDDRKKFGINKLVIFSVKYNYATEVIKEELLSTNNNKYLLSNSVVKYFESRTKIDKKIKFGVFPCQDTILPFYFESDYNINLNVEFVKFESWSEGVNAFQEDEIQIALHSFPTVLAACKSNTVFSPSFFYPLFSFSGYGLFIKRKFINKQIEHYSNSTNFNDLTKIQKKEILKNSRVLVEKGTDFEWAVIEFMKKNGLSNDDYEIIDYNTNEAKHHFVEGEKGDLYCTNPIHILDILGGEEVNPFELIFIGDDFNHNNFNGIIATKDFVEQNFNVIGEIIHIWFKNIHYFKSVIEKYSKKKRSNWQNG